MKEENREIDKEEIIEENQEKLSQTDEIFEIVDTYSAKNEIEEDLNSPIKSQIPIQENNKQTIKDAQLEMYNKEEDVSPPVMERVEAGEETDSPGQRRKENESQSPIKQFTQKSSPYYLENQYSIPVKYRAQLKKEQICTAEYKTLLKQNVPTKCMPLIKVRGRTLCIHPNLNDTDTDTSQLDSEINKQVQPRNPKLMFEEYLYTDNIYTLDIDKEVYSEDSTELTSFSPKLALNQLGGLNKVEMSPGGTLVDNAIRMKYTDSDLSSIKKSQSKTPPQPRGKIVDLSKNLSKEINDKKINGQSSFSNKSSPEKEKYNK